MAKTGGQSGGNSRPSAEPALLVDHFLRPASPAEIGAALALRALAYEAIERAGISAYSWKRASIR